MTKRDTARDVTRDAECDVTRNTHLDPFHLAARYSKRINGLGRETAVGQRLRNGGAPLVRASAEEAQPAAPAIANGGRVDDSGGTSKLLTGAVHSRAHPQFGGRPAPPPGTAATTFEAIAQSLATKPLHFTFAPPRHSRAIRRTAQHDAT